MKPDSTSDEDWTSFVSGPYRNTVAAFVERIRAEERERCAKLCDAMGGAIDPRDPDESRLTANELAAAIRASR